jgi:Ca2+-binding RTX toxin-like protein
LNSSCDDTLIGGPGNDTLDGGTGADSLVGGTGNDTYYVDDAGDVVSEKVGKGTVNEGVDTVVTSLDSYTLGGNVEYLTYDGSGNFFGTGNGLSNRIIGGAGADTLIADGGEDTLIGGAGGDSLSAGTGADSLDGGAGADTMSGGSGNDTYVVDDAGDVVVENAGEGTDTIKTSLAAYTLGANVENMFFTGVIGFTGIGNALANRIDINSTFGGSISGLGGNDTMFGGSGNDTIDGGAGVDALKGSQGADVFVFHKGEANGDTVGDFSHNAADVLNFVGYGAGSTLARPDPAGHPNDWVITDGVDHTTETIHMSGHPALTAGVDYFFV